MFLGVQPTSVGMGKIFNNSNNNNNTKQQFIDSSNISSFNNVLPNQEINNNNNLDSISNLTDKLNDFPFNLLPEIN